MAVLLAKFEQCSLDEIAAAMGLSVPAVKSLFRARDQLRPPPCSRSSPPAKGSPDGTSRRCTARPPSGTPQDVLGDVWDGARHAAAGPHAGDDDGHHPRDGRRHVAGPRGRRRALLGSWLLAAVVVAGCFAIGLVVGATDARSDSGRAVPRLPPREAIREIIEEEMAKQRRQQWDRVRGAASPAETSLQRLPAPPR